MVAKPLCEVHKKPGEYAWGMLVICPDCRIPPKKVAPPSPDFSGDEITEDTSAPPWFRYPGIVRLP